MGLFDYMDESSELYSEARDAVDQMYRSKRLDDTHSKEARDTAEKAFEDHINNHTDAKTQRDIIKHVKYATLAAADGRSKEAASDKYIQKATHTTDAVLRHNRRHPDSKVGESTLFEIQ